MIDWLIVHPIYLWSFTCSGSWHHSFNDIFSEIQTFWWYVRSTLVSSLSLFPSDYCASLIYARLIHSTVYVSTWLSELVCRLSFRIHTHVFSSYVFVVQPSQPFVATGQAIVLSASESWLQLLYHGFSIFVLKMQPHSELSPILLWFLCV